MFDIKDYYREPGKAAHRKERDLSIGEIEEDISRDLDRLLANRFDSLYLRDKFKHRSTGVEIIYPRIMYTCNKSLFKGPDQIKNLLSLYPKKCDLENISKIVLRPRYIDIGMTELMALYIRRRRILVMYLFHPHTYNLHKSRFFEYAEMYPGDLVNYLNELKNVIPKRISQNDIPIPPLWYILSIINAEEEDIVDKFFIRKTHQENREITSQLCEISFFYSRHGY